MVETFFWRGLVDSEKRKRERERNENREKKQQLTSVATPALTRTEDRREPARGRAAAAAGAADERRRAAAAAAAGLRFFLVDREGQRKEILVWSRPTKRERERGSARSRPSSGGGPAASIAFTPPPFAAHFSLVLPHSHPIAEV